MVVQGQHRVVSPGEMPQKRHMLPLFSGLTLFLAFAVHWRSWRGPRPAWLCGSFSGWLKPGSQSLTHRKSVRTIVELTLDRSASWQEDLRRLRHLEVVVDEEGAAVQWGAQVEVAVLLQHRRPLRLGVPVGLRC